MTTGWAGEGPAAMFVAVDHPSAECVGLHASRQGTRFEALEPLRQGVREQIADRLEQVAIMRADNRSRSSGAAMTMRCYHRR